MIARGSGVFDNKQDDQITQRNVADLAVIKITTKIEKSSRKDLLTAFIYL